MAEEERFFEQGEKVRISKKSRVVDTDRAQEGEKDLPPIDQDVTGCEGSIHAAPYESPMKDGEVCVPIRLKNGAIVGVPENRLESAGSNKKIHSGVVTNLFRKGWERIFGRKG